MKLGNGGEVMTAELMGEASKFCGLAHAAYLVGLVLFEGPLFEDCGQRLCRLGTFYP